MRTLVRSMLAWYVAAIRERALVHRGVYGLKVLRERTLGHVQTQILEPIMRWDTLESSDLSFHPGFRCDQSF